MKARFYIAGTMLAIFGALLFTPQAFAGERNRGHQRVSHNGNQHYNQGGHHYARHGYSSQYRTHRNGHLIGAAVYAIGGLIHHQQHARNAGHYESRQVLVRDGYYEEYRVHVPARYGHHGVLIERAHHETRSRWIAPVYRSERVWVPRY
ncbi:MAG: hypothetical protein IID08_04335 [Candidatus Hydrogenedentes bacterium]|nr:hypothetical protein [Candidatus Hydrogenedentota bacterium]